MQTVNGCVESGCLGCGVCMVFACGQCANGERGCCDCAKKNDAEGHLCSGELCFICKPLSKRLDSMEIHKQKNIGSIFAGIAEVAIPIVIDMIAALARGQNPLEKLAAERVAGIIPQPLLSRIALAEKLGFPMDDLAKRAEIASEKLMRLGEIHV